jgi:hypothetical protein
MPYDLAHADAFIAGLLQPRSLTLRGHVFPHHPGPAVRDTAMSTYLMCNG